MKIEEQVLSIDQMNHLKELGLEVKDTAFSWCEVYKDMNGKKIENPPYTLLREPSLVAPLAGWRTFPTLTLQEILDMLPKEIDGAPMEIGYTPNGYAKPYFIHYFLYEIDYVREEIDVIEICEDTLLECAYKMLVWVIENGYLKE